MASNSETIYIKAGRNTEVKKPDITLGEVLEITCVNPSMEAKVRSLRLLKGINGRVAVSVLKVVSMIQIHAARKSRVCVSAEFFRCGIFHHGI